MLVEVTAAGRARRRAAERRISWGTGGLVMGW